MTYASGTHPANTPIRTTLATALSAGGLTRVTQDYVVASGQTLDVWKSPAASNTAGTDWYLLLLDQVSSPTRQFQVTVCEGWDDATKTATRYIPITNNVVPAGDFSIGATGVSPTQANVLYVPGFNGFGTWTDSSGTTYKISATPNRVIITVGTGSAYAGHMDRVLNQTLEPTQPLGALELGGNTTFTNASTSRGGTTREPGQTLANAANWRIYQVNNTSDHVWGIFTESFSGASVLPLLWVKSNRFSSNRAILKDCKGGNNSGAASDIATETQVDGTTTITYWQLNTQAPTSNVQRFAAQI